MKLIWIDFENSPHVLFFRPVIRALEKRGYRILLTARDAYNVLELVERFGLDCRPIGRHYGKHMAMKGFGLLNRAVQLFALALKDRPALALSHGSRAQVLVANLLHVPSLLIQDYEYSGGMGIPHVRSTKFMCPDVIPTRDNPKFLNRIRKYPGIKEEIYIPEFEPDPSIYEEVGVRQDDLIVTLRPPATSAHYHLEASDDAFSEALGYLLEHPEVKIVLLPRTAQQAEACRRTWKEAFRQKKIVVPERAVDGVNLSWHSDLVVSGGGTMNREAATLGVPVYSIFQGTIGAVDQYLSDKGRLTLIRRVEDVRTSIEIKRRNKDGKPSFGDSGALSVILDQIEKMVHEVAS